MENLFKYSHLTLRPHEPRIRHLFWQFRLEDVYQQYELYTIVVVLFVLAHVVIFIFTRDVTDLINAIYSTFFMMMILFIYILGPRM